MKPPKNEQEKIKHYMPEHRMVIPARNADPAEILEESHGLVYLCMAITHNLLILSFDLK